MLTKTIPLAFGNEITARDKSRTTPSCIISDDVPVNDQQSIATIMNEYFTTIGSKLANKIKEKFKPKAVPQPSSHFPYCFEFKEVDESLIFCEVRKLKTNKAIGLDRISAKLLKDSASAIAPSLTKIINMSLLFDKKLITGAVFIDLRKALDTVDHCMTSTTSITRLKTPIFLKKLTVKNCIERN